MNFEHHFSKLGKQSREVYLTLFHSMEFPKSNKTEYGQNTPNILD